MTILLIIILILLILNPNIVSKEVLNSCNMWFSTMLPIMYPSFIVIDLIENSYCVYRLSIILYPLFQKIFRINSPKSVFIILLSFICGAPASTKIIASSLEKNEIDYREAHNLVSSFSSLSLPYTILICKTVNMSVLLFYLCYIAMSIILMRILNKSAEAKKVKMYQQKQFTNIFLDSIRKNTDIMINILGILIIFRVIIKLFIKDDFLLYPYIEILGGLQEIKNPIITLSALGFLGLSVHLQIISIMKNLNYKKFLFSRMYYLLLGLLAFLLS